MLTLFTLLFCFVKIIINLCGGDNLNLGNKIKKIRYKYNISQEDLAEILEVNRNYISRIETNKSLPTVDILVKLALAFNISIDNWLEINVDNCIKTRKDKINKINKYCEELDNKDLDYIIRLFDIMSNNK